MGKIELKRPSPALIVAMIALVFSLAGNAGAFSSHKIKKGEIAKGAVTASALAKGAVTAKAVRKGAVTAKALAPNAVGSAALGPDAVTARAVAPSSIYGYALGPVATVTAPIKDEDAAADLSTWTNSNTASATCAPGARILGGGVTFLNPGNRRVGTIASAAVSNGPTNAWIGQITTDSGGTAEAQVQAVCLQAGP